MMLIWLQARQLDKQTNSQVYGNTIRYGNTGSLQAFEQDGGPLKQTHSRSQIWMKSQQRWTLNRLNQTPLQKMPIL